MALAAENQLILDDRVRVEDGNGGYALVSNAGSLQTEIGSNAQVGDVWSLPDVLLRPGARVEGDAHTAGTVIVQTGGEVVGETFEGQVLTPVSTATWTETLPTPFRGNRTLYPDTTLALPPGAYGAVVVHSRARLRLSSGVYSFGSLTLYAEANMEIDAAAGPVKLFVRWSLTDQGTVEMTAGAPEDFFLFYLGNGNVAIEGALKGTIVAPNATLDLYTLNGAQHRAAFFAQNIHVYPDNVIVHETETCVPEDDGNPCTDDICDENGEPAHVPVENGTPCGNEDVCDGEETCQEGVCEPGTPLDPDDGNPCTEDSCDPVDGVIHTPQPYGTRCLDDTVCNGAELCDSWGNCMQGTPLDPDDGNPCTDDSCDPVDGAINTPLPAGTSCADSTVCNGEEVCDANAVCEPGTQLDPDDGNPCTADVCHPVDGVINLPVAAGTSCADETVCNGDEVCDGSAVCEPGTPLDPDDGNACTEDSCDPVNGVVNTPVAAGTSCADDTVCNGDEVCDGSGACQGGTPLDPDDGNICTEDSCDPVNGVVHTPVAAGTSCADADVCNGSETCDGSGACQDGTPLDPDDGNICTEDSCDPVNGVVHTPVAAGTSCADGDVCNGSEVCDGSGACQGGTPLDPDDGNVCTEDSCDPVNGVINTPVTAGTSCADGDVCNGNETCDGSATCQPGTPLDPDDGNTCTADSCDPVNGVVNTPVAAGTGCADGDVCNGSEVCDGSGICQGGTPLDPDDGNPCTDDSCDPVNGVINTPVAAGTGCADADLCNGSEVCDGSATCQPGTPLDPDDGNVCTEDSCDPSVGVINTPVAAGTSCSDDDLCNGNETCDSAGDCIGGAPPVLDDGNPCTVDSCDPVTGVSHTPAPEGTSCSDADACNGEETCDADGVCIGGPPPMVDDGNPCTEDLCDPSTGEVDHLPEAAGTPCDACGAECDDAGFCVSDTPPIADDGDPCTLEVCDPVTGVAVHECPALDRTVATNVDTAVSWIYEGPDAVQTGVEEGTIELERAAVIRGRVFDVDGEPLPGVEIDALHHEEYGQTVTQASGWFDFVVNGGETFTIRYRRPDLLEVQRKVTVGWDDYAVAPEVVMTAHDPVVTTVDLSDPDPMQLVQGSEIVDDDGFRQATLLVPEGTTATMVFDDGATAPLETMSVRITELTVGDTGPEAMPGELPANVLYTYAFEVNADEAVSAGARNVVFNQELPVYVENFIGFPVGETVPVGSYDRLAGRWVPEESGLVVEVVGEAGGLAELDLTGDGIAADQTELDELGITDAELERVAELYEPGDTLWRIAIAHFTQPWDCNWSGGPPEGATPPPDPDPTPGDSPLPNANSECGSYIECQNRAFRESLDIAGTPYSLAYSSRRVPGRGDAQRSFTVTLSEEELHPDLETIELYVYVAGRLIYEDFPPQTNLTHTVQWDGLDAYDRPVQGATKAKVVTAYRYPLVYGSTSRFSRPGGVTIYGDRATGSILLTRQETVVLNGQDNSALGLGGWSLDVHHVYDPTAQILNLGNGEHADATSITREWRSSWSQGSPYLRDFVEDGVGGQYYLTWGPDIRHRSAEGEVTILLDGTVDNAAPGVLARASDGIFYYSYNYRVYRFDPATGDNSVFAGNGSAQDSGDEGPAVEAGIGSVGGLALGPDDTLYIAARGRVRKVTADGIITTVAGNGNATPDGDGPALQSTLANPSGIAIGPDGSIYVAEGITTHYSWGTRYGHIRRITPDGQMVTVEGLNCPYHCDSGYPIDVSVSNDGHIYAVTKSDGGVYALPPGGGKAARLLSLSNMTHVESDNRGGVTFQRIGTIGKVEWALPSVSEDDHYIASADRSEVYHFTGDGRHLETLNAVTGAVRYAFEYNEAGQLASVTDLDGKITTVVRDGDGSPLAIVGPYGHTSELELDAEGYLEVFRNPLLDTAAFDYADGGLMTSFANFAGQVSTFEYTPEGLLIRDTNAAGGYWELDQEGEGTQRTVTKTSAMGVATEYDVDIQGTLGTERVNTFPDGTVSTASLAANGVMRTTMPDGTQVTTTRKKDPIWGMQSPLTTVDTTLPSGLTRTVTTDRTATVSIANPGQIEDETVTINENGRSTRITYDGATRRYEIRSPAYRWSWRDVDELGRTTRVQRGNLLPTTFSYDDDGRLVSTTQGTRTMDLSYYDITGDENGYLASITDPEGITTYFSPDALGRTLTQTTAGNSTDLDWDEVGNLTGVTPPGKPIHEQSYTPVNLLETYLPPTAGLPDPSTSYTYNLDKQLSHTLQPGGIAVDRSYDSEGRLELMTTPMGFTEYSYYAPDCSPSPGCAPGRLASLVGPGNVAMSFSYDGSLTTGVDWAGDVNGTVAWSHDDSFRVIGETVSDGANTSAAEFGYNADSLLTCASPTTCSPVSDDALALSYDTNGLLTTASLGDTTVTHTYNGYGELASATVSHSGSAENPMYAVVYDSTEVPRDNLGRVVQKTETRGSSSTTWAYEYNDLGRLVSVSENGTMTEAYTYDPNGNRLSFTSPSGSVTSTYDDQDRLIQDDNVEYAYTPNGALQGKIDIATGDVWTYEYDARGNLLSVELPDATLVEYAVDGRNRRVAHSVNGTIDKRWLYRDQLNPVAQLDAGGYLEWQYVYATKPHVPDFAVRVSDGAVYRIVTDQLGSVVLVVNIEDASDVLLEARYSAFGEQEVIEGSADTVPFGFAGGLYDEDTGLVRFGARDFDPSIGRWTSKEPLRFAGAMNFYVYALGDPVTFIDINGFNPIAWGAIGGGIGAGVYYAATADMHSGWSGFGRDMLGLGGAIVGGALAGAAGAIGLEAAAAGAAGLGVGIAVTGGAAGQIIGDLAAGKCFNPLSALVSGLANAATPLITKPISRVATPYLASVLKNGGVGEEAAKAAARESTREGLTGFAWGILGGIGADLAR